MRTGKNHLLILGASRVHHGIIANLRRSGVSVTVFHLNGRSYSPESASHTLRMDELELPSEFNWIFHCNERHEPGKLGLKAPSSVTDVDTTFVTPTKARQRRLVGSNVEFRVIPRGVTRVDLSNRISTFLDLFPIAVLKPSEDSGGSRGVSIVRRDTWPREGSAQADSLYSALRATDYLIEEFIQAQQFCADGWKQGRELNILGIGECITMPNNPTVLQGIVYSHDLLDARQDSTVRSYLGTWLNALQIPDGPFHVEFFLKDGTPIFIEGHARFGGSLIPEALLHFSAINCFRLGFDRTFQAEVGKSSAVKITFRYDLPSRSTSKLPVRLEGPGYAGHFFGGAPGQRVRDASQRTFYALGWGSCVLEAESNLHSLEDAMGFSQKSVHSLEGEGMR